MRRSVFALGNEHVLRVTDGKRFEYQLRRIIVFRFDHFVSFTTICAAVVITLNPVSPLLYRQGVFVCNALGYSLDKCISRPRLPALLLRLDALTLRECGGDLQSCLFLFRARSIPSPFTPRPIPA